ncbi:MAG: HPF/RaiA family ribosome-associated protein [Nitrospiraceae bacterium]|nr:HPF/RaiA family ribosome-associated protein [Nitrospiraceae bacterium]
METPLRVTYKNLGPQYKESIEEEIGALSGKMEKFSPSILSCRVVVGMPHKRRHDGNLFRTTVTLNVPGRRIVVSRDRSLRRTYENIYVAVRHAFDDAVRQLEEYSLRQSRQVKAHDLLPRGVVTKLFREEGYGFIEGFGGREIYFHRNSVLDGFEKLREGSPVRFEEEEGEKGPQASTVKILRKTATMHRRH